MSGIRAISDVLFAKSPLTPKQHQAIQDVHDLAFAYVALDKANRPGFRVEVRKTTNGRQRWLATKNTPPEHRAFVPLMTLLDDLIADQGLIKTAKGWFSEEELAAAEVKFERENGRTLIVFPWLYPWRSKPENNGTGVRDDARYRAPEERHPFRGTFSQQGPRAVAQEQEPDWWDVEDGEA